MTNLKQAAKKAGCDLRLHLKDEGHNHIPPTAPTPDYKTNPPTSGNHVEPPYQQADGAYSEMPQEIDIVHSLEHGRMEIQYSPDLPEEDQLELNGLYDTMYGGTLLFPNENMPYEVAATTWTNLLGCNEYKGAITLDAIRDFGKATWGHYGGEPVNAFAFTGPTPAEPTDQLSPAGAVGGEEAARVAPGREARRRRPRSQTISEVCQGCSRLAKPRLNSSSRSPRVMPPPRLSGRPSSAASSTRAATTFFIGESRRWESALPLR